MIRSGVADVPVSCSRVGPMGTERRGPQADQAENLRLLVASLTAARAAGADMVPALDEMSPGGDVMQGACGRDRGHMVAIASGKGGVGKTCLAVNLAIALSQRGQRVTLVDADLGLANADVLCGLTPTRRLEQAVGESRPDLASMAVEAPGGFRLVPGSAGIARMADLSPARRAQLVAGVGRLTRSSDVVLIDTGAGIAPGVTDLLIASDTVAVVATPEPTSITDAYALIKCVAPMRGAGKQAREGRIALAVNLASDEREAFAVHQRISMVCQRFLGYRLPFIGWVARDPKVLEAVRLRSPLLLSQPRSRAAKQIELLAGALADLLSLAPRPQGPGKSPKRPRRNMLDRLLGR